MNIFLDTNIFLGIIRSKKVDELLKFLNPEKNTIYTSVIVEAEIKFIALRNKWGKDKIAKLEFYLNQFSFIELTKTFVNTYVEIDTYSQKVNPNFTTHNFDTPRNMRKNDLWIAATASILGLKLITTDSDFSHLNEVFLDVRQIDIASLKIYF